MAKFRNDNLDLETGEHIDFDDADTIQMGYDGSELYINSTVSGVRAAQPHQMVRYDQLEEGTTGSGSHTNIQLNFYKGERDPFAKIKEDVYTVLGDAPYTPLATQFTTVTMVIQSADTGVDHDGYMQIYDITNVNELLEFSWSGIRDWTIVTATGINNLPTTPSIFEFRVKRTSVEEGRITHVILF